MFLIFDTETTGLPKSWNAPITDSDNWPRLVQLAWQLHEANGALISQGNIIVKPDGFTIPYNAEKVHGISTEKANREGSPLIDVLRAFHKDLAKAQYVVGHNISFDISVVGAEYYRIKQEPTLLVKSKLIDTKDASTDFCALPGGKGGKYKWPTLTELYEKLFNSKFESAHDAAYDVSATAKCFFGLVTNSVIKLNEVSDPSVVVYQAPELAAANFEKPKPEEKKAEPQTPVSTEVSEELNNVTFTHLHCHSQFSILQSTSPIAELVAKAKEFGMKSVALTDHANLMGAFSFVKECYKQGISPILGCEFNICENRKNKDKQDNGFQIPLIAKNKSGYQNLCKLSSYSFTEGSYYVPRIDKELLVQYKENLIATTGGLWGEVPYLILNVGEKQAEEAFVWWKETFGDDFYVELTRHGLEEENIVNETMIRFAKTHGVKYFASNNVYYTNRVDAEAHDILLCVKDAEPISKPKKYIGKKGREFRYGFPNDEFYFKSANEMKVIFQDLPEAIECTNDIVSKIEPYKLERSVLLPKFGIPKEFVDLLDETDNGTRGEMAYLRHLTYEGAKKRYKEITPEIKERLDFELNTVEKTGYPGYFLIVQDFTKAAREMGVSVGPGRGSAAGSAVAYCTGITNIDPIKYDLLFERFLNPDRVSMPDIDIDFDDEGRDKVINYVINKYGANQVAQIITYGTMAAKSSVRDTARALELPLPDADRLAKLIPDISLEELFKLSSADLSKKLKNKGEEVDKAESLKKIALGTTLESQTLKQATILEGSVRNTGIHACGVIITPDDITNFVPIATAKDSDMFCTQFDNSVVESAGLLKMDFLGLKTLTLIKDACAIVKEKHGVDLDPDNFPLDDAKTYELFQKGETVGIFQYESKGMQKYMRELKPTVFADLIAMNALYRPGPLEYIPSFIKRKHGTEEITYDIDDCKEYLEETYGITVYQEQVMLLSQKLANFTKGEADVLRKAMGKKQRDVLDKMKPKFITQALEKGHAQNKLEKIWKDWESFAEYAFNKSHSTCYAWIAYQTAYLKAHYPAEYMASVLSNNMNDLKTVTFFMEECKRAGISVLGPDVNESNFKFTVNDKGQVRFGLGAVKGVGEGAVENIVIERKKTGLYQSLFDFYSRIDHKSVNKKASESLALSGAFDCFKGTHRAMFFHDDGGRIFLEKAISYGANVQESKNSAQASLFGDHNSVDLPAPAYPFCEEWGTMEKLSKERDVVGIYITGHPLDDYSIEMQYICNATLTDLKPEVMSKFENKDFRVGGIVTEAQHLTSKAGKPWGKFTFEDYNDTLSFNLFSNDYVKFRPFLNKGWFLLLSGTVKKSKFKEDTLEVYFSKFELLSEVKDNFTKSITLSLRLKDITENMLNTLSETISSHKGGECKLKLEIWDEEENISLPLTSKSHKVSVSKELLDVFQREDINFKLN